MVLLEALKLLSDLLFFLSYVSGGSSFPNPMSEQEESDCIRRLEQGDISAKNELIEHNLRLVAHIAKKYAGNGRDMDDIISIGTIGLIKAVNTYNANKGRSIGTYAARCIENEILMAIRAEKKSRNEIPLNESIGSDKDGNKVLLMDILGTPHDAVDEAVEKSLNISRLYKALGASLSQREKIIIELRYGLLTGTCKTQREIAAALGISRSYVSRQG